MSNPTFAIILNDRDSFKMRSLGLEPLFLSDLLAMLRYGSDVIAKVSFTIPLFNFERMLFHCNVKIIAKTSGYFSEDQFIRMKLCNNLIFVSPYPSRLETIGMRFGFGTMSTFDLFEKRYSSCIAIALERSIEFAIIWRLVREYDCSYISFTDIITMSRNNQERKWCDQKIR